MKTFITDDFLLNSEPARRLYHEYAEGMPIFDYHCHLNPQEIYEDKQFSDIGEAWLAGDHYKWRVMRTCGVPEEYVTGKASFQEKFQRFAAVMPALVGNPIYHWSHLELLRFFGIEELLDPASAPAIWDKANSVLQSPQGTARALITSSKVRALCTTDDPADDLAYHKKIAALPDFDCKVLPTFRPDKALNIQAPDFADYMGALAAAAGMEIHTVDDVIAALRSRAEYFHSVGCRVSDQAFDVPPYAPAAPEQVQAVFAKALAGAPVTEQEAQIYKTPVLLALGKLYHELHWTMEVHIGAMRNNNSRMFRALGPDTGFDSVDDGRVARPLSRLLDAMDSTDSLPKTILFNLNDKDNTVLATMLGNFQSTEAASKIQYGPAWWFLDTMDGMTAQLKSLGNLGVLGKFVGMETDSRSFTSYGRHAYFRRILCALIGRWVEQGWYANDDAVLKEIVQGISYNNAIAYFDFA